MPLTVPDCAVIVNDLKDSYKDHLWDSRLICGRTGHAPVNQFHEPLTDTPSINLLSWDDYCDHRNLNNPDPDDCPDTLCKHCWNKLTTE